MTDDYDWRPTNLILLCHKDGTPSNVEIPAEMYRQLLDLESRRNSLSDDEYCNELCRILCVPRDLMDKVSRMSADLRQQVSDGSITLEEATKRSRN